MPSNFKKKKNTHSIHLYMPFTECVAAFVHTNVRPQEFAMFIRSFDVECIIVVVLKMYWRWFVRSIHDSV